MKFSKRSYDLYLNHGCGAITGQNSLKATAEELEIILQTIIRPRTERVSSQVTEVSYRPQVSQEQPEILRLKKAGVRAHGYTRKESLHQDFP